MRGDGGGTDDGDERQLRRSSDSSSAPTWPDSISSATSPTAGLPAFTYSPSVKRNIGETVRLLPACLHLYHAECIDPWLDAHTTCPLCRSDTDRRSSALGDVPWHAIV
ncbi:hypothetical protein E2562_019857 [Oryza meyeriana var. granulata]|uniref:RING-type domain-containing protein n=1 Tax=Oryza meyeriana var. granulata TaxID=110450 RepID=A0A6G1CS23_9ORYZ|nr:hypothetical protein E2562_019857 [Oryza meyeriana var. granulata]